MGIARQDENLSVARDENLIAGFLDVGHQNGLRRVIAGRPREAISPFSYCRGETGRR